MSSSSFFTTTAGLGNLASNAEVAGSLGKLAGGDGVFDQAELTALLKKMGVSNQDVRDAASTLLNGEESISAEDLTSEIMGAASGPNGQLTAEDFEGFLEGLTEEEESENCCCNCDNNSSSSSSDGLTDKGEEFFEEQAGLGGEFNTAELESAIAQLAGGDGALDQQEAKKLAMQYLGLSRSEAKEMFEDLAVDGKISTDDLIQDIMIFANENGTVDMDALNEWADSFQS